MAQNQASNLDQTEMILLKLHSSLIDFYLKHKPENLDEDVLTILMQFFIDSGGAALNRKLRSKYGEDLNTFNKVRTGVAPPQTSERTSRAIEMLKRRSFEKAMDMSLPPEQKTEVNKAAVRKSYQQHTAVPPISSSSLDRRKKKKKRVIDDPELKKFKAEKNRARMQLEADIDKDLFGDDEPVPKEDPSLRLDVLDDPKEVKLKPRDYIEAFYSKYDQTKLDREEGVDKFVLWVEQNTLEGLDTKLKGKYPEGLFEQESLARRRRNLEDKLTTFYTKHDKPKLGSRYTILQIISWTLTNGVVALNKKFKTRYGLDVIPIKQKKIRLDELDI